MKFKILLRTKSGKERSETYDEDITDPIKWAENTINYFNRTLKPGEESVILINVEILDDRNDKYHRWVKQNCTSVNFKGSIVDLFKCERCGLTGKKYGLAGTVTIDSKYNKKVFRECHTAKKEMEKNVDTPLVKARGVSTAICFKIFSGWSILLKKWTFFPIDPLYQFRPGLIIFLMHNPNRQFCYQIDNIFSGGWDFLYNLFFKRFQFFSAS